MKQEKILIKNIQIYADNQYIEQGFIKIINGKIETIGDMDNLTETNSYHVLSFAEETKAIPGLIDVHIHGANGADVMDATAEALDTMAQALPAEGTTAFLATTMTQSEANIEKALTATAAYMEEQPVNQAEIIGIHLEGPFVNAKRKGAQPEEYIQKPNISLFQKWNKLANQHIRLVTLAPELDEDLTFTKYLADHGIIPSAGHTDATAEEIDTAINHGLSHITHLYNQMRGFHHREAGVVGASWLRKELMVELIADGIHSTPEAAKIAFDLKGEDRLLLITDAMRAKCLQDGEYELGGQKVLVENQKATLEDGTIAGSTLRLGNGLKNMMDFAGCTVEEVIKMGSTNAAIELGIADRKGSIAAGKDADIVLLDKHHDIILTLCRGEVAYERE
ncbi:N-acetylglucosamine-6-phosphate deacetylase [Gracilibacillus alcaliphilus]|uniref:N-acetylglucosamine-6-phosphate deacetylase n=1 Tax=Gracilibacillus alcaliphilus TaxID=1401441 RepID=UPI0019592658|nr:N-acetylglucosamine-6-phosphate deacetylase [Gracilibacillus alcaliphilus]